MRSFSIIHIVLFVILMLAYQCAAAQDYVITTKGDTITGIVKPLNFGADKKVQVTEPGKKKTVYSLFQVNSFSLSGDTFKPVKGPAGYTFMKIIKPGYLSLLAFQQENQTTYDGMYLLKRDGQGVEVPNLAFKKTLKNFLNDCGNISDKIENGELAKKDLHQIIDEYNACVEGKKVITQKQLVQRAEQVQKLNPWDALETKVKSQADFEGKNDALEMISEIKTKISRSEKIPKFMVDGLKGTLSHPNLQPELEKALAELN
jgi:hypothetical protein